MQFMNSLIISNAMYLTRTAGIETTVEENDKGYPEQCILPALRELKLGALR